MPTAHKVLVKAGESALGSTSAFATATSSSTADAWEVFQFQVSEEHRLNEVDKFSIEEFLHHWLVVLNGCNENSKLKPIFDNKMTETKPPKNLESIRQEAMTRYKELTFTQIAIYTAVSKEYFKRHDEHRNVNDTNVNNSSNRKSYYDSWEVFKFQLSEEHRLNNKVFNTVDEFLYHWLVIVNNCDEKSSPKPIFKHKRRYRKTTISTESKSLESFQQEAMARYQQLTFTKRALYRAISKEYFRKKTEEDSPVKLKSNKDKGGKKKKRDSVNVGNEMKKKPKKVVDGCGSRREGDMKMPGKKIGPEKLKGNDEAKKKRSSVSWDERFQQLVEYRDQNGHCRVPTKNYKANTQLGDWVRTQRKAYKKGKLLPEQINSLEGIGFVWELKKLEIVGWDERFKQLKEYRQVKGDCRVPQRYKANPQLGKWVSTQRTAYKKNKLSPEQIKSLEDIGFKWVCLL